MPVIARIHQIIIRMSKYLRKYGRYNFDRVVPDHRIAHDFNHPFNNLMSFSKLRTYRNYFVGNFVRHFPILSCSLILGLGFVFTEGYLLTHDLPADGIQYDPTLRSVKYVENMNDKTNGPYNSRFRCFKNQPGCGDDSTI